MDKECAHFCLKSTSTVQVYDSVSNNGLSEINYVFNNVSMRQLIGDNMWFKYKRFKICMHDTKITSTTTITFARWIKVYLSGLIFENCYELGTNSTLYYTTPNGDTVTNRASVGLLPIDSSTTTYINMSMPTDTGVIFRKDEDYVNLTLTFEKMIYSSGFDGVNQFYLYFKIFGIEEDDET